MGGVTGAVILALCRYPRGGVVGEDTLLSRFVFPVVYQDRLLATDIRIRGWRSSLIPVLAPADAIDRAADQIGKVDVGDVVCIRLPGEVAGGAAKRHVFAPAVDAWLIARSLADASVPGAADQDQAVFAGAVEIDVGQAVVVVGDQALLGGENDRVAVGAGMDVGRDRPIDPEQLQMPTRRRR